MTTKLKVSAAGETTVAPKDRRPVAEEMRKFLASTYGLYVMTQNFHWNVTGPLFDSLHVLFEKQYIELAAAVDVVAERIRALGFQAPGTFREFLEFSILEEPKDVPASEQMVGMLIQAHTAVAQQAAHIISLSEEAGDISTTDILTDRITAHEKAMWMLRSILS